jgi:hypothetical protein
MTFRPAQALRPVPGMARALLAGALLAAACLASAAPPDATASTAKMGASGTRRPPASRNHKREEARPTWAELTPVQQQTLAPLAASWRSLSEAHKRKWLALSRNYPKMQPEEQAKLRGRMTEWATLSPQQRTAARLNFAETKKVSPVDKKAAWEAYQALSPEEKKRLAADAREVKPQPPPTAAAVKPVSPQKLARVPKPQEGDTRAPRIVATPEPLPGPANPVAAPAPAASGTPKR